MNGHTTTAEKYGNVFMTLIFLVFASGTALAQVPVDEDGNTIPAYYEDDLDGVDAGEPAPAEGAVLSSAELEQLVGPVALYPDDLLAIVLPASTYPLEIVEAARFLDRLDSDSSLKPDEKWDDSIVALLNYPDVVRMMNDDIDWTWNLGEAVISQQAEVIAAVEAFRDRAYAAGNLKSDENQTVTHDDGAIEISPVDDEIIYVPYYEPEEVVVYQPRPVYHYYPEPYPVYYYPYPLGYSFGSGYFWGVTTAFQIGWSNHYLHVYHPSYWGHPYYGYTYYDYYYRRPSISVYNSWYVNNNYRHSNYHYRDGDYWRPRTRAGSRQDEPRVRNHHYPPGDNRRDGDRPRDHRSAPNQLANRDNGRLALNLRERSNSDRNRVAAANNVRTGVTAGNVNNRRTALRDRGTANTTDRNSVTRTPSNNGSARTAGSSNRNRAATNSPAPDQNRARSSARRPDIQFRDRSNDSRSTNSRHTAGQSRRDLTNRSGQSAPINSSSFVQREAPSHRSVAPRAATPSVQRRAPAARVTARRSSTPRATAPRVSAPPRARAPSVSAPPRAAAPRASAPRVSSAPRAQAPRAAPPPQRSAPSSSNRSSGQSRSGGSQSRRSSQSSRPRNHNN